MICLRNNKSYWLFLIIFYFTIFNFSNAYFALEKIFPVIRLIDEFIAVTAIPLFLYDSLKKRSFSSCRTVYFILLFFIIGLAGNYIYDYQPFLRAVLPDAFLCIKFWLAIYTGYCLFPYFFVKDYAQDIYLHVRIVTWVYIILLILDFVAGGIFHTELRYGFRTTYLFYFHPTILVSCCAFLLVILLSIRDYAEVNRKYYLILCFC